MTPSRTAAARTPRRSGEKAPTVGAICAPQNPLYTDRELEESLGASQPETVVTLTPFYERVKRCQRATGVKRSSQ